MRNVLLALLVTLCLASSGIALESKIDGRKKDECLLDSNKCEQRGGYPILEKIERLKAAVEQGGAVYTPQELELLKKKLQEAQEVNDLIQG